LKAINEPVCHNRAAFAAFCWTSLWRAAGDATALSTTLFHQHGGHRAQRPNLYISRRVSSSTM
jgi:hypothetical protein